jgi:hypothetical protein
MEASGEEHPPAWVDRLKETITIGNRCRTTLKNKGTSWPLLPPFRENLWGIVWGINF